MATKQSTKSQPDSVEEPVKVNKWDGSAVKNAIDDAVKETITGRLKCKENFGLMDGRLALCGVAVGVAAYALLWDYLYPFPESRPVLILCVSSYFVLMGFLTLYTTIKEKGIFIIATPNEGAYKCIEASSNLKKYDDKYALSLSVKDGKGARREVTVTKSVANFIAEDGTVLGDLVEDEVMKLYNSLGNRYETQDKNRKTNGLPSLLTCILFTNIIHNTYHPNLPGAASLTNNSMDGDSEDKLERLFSSLEDFVPNPTSAIPSTSLKRPARRTRDNSKPPGLERPLKELRLQTPDPMEEETLPESEARPLPEKKKTTAPSHHADKTARKQPPSAAERTVTHGAAYSLPDSCPSVECLTTPLEEPAPQHSEDRHEPPPRISSCQYTISQETADYLLNPTQNPPLDLAAQFDKWRLDNWNHLCAPAANSQDWMFAACLPTTMSNSEFIERCKLAANNHQIACWRMNLLDPGQLKKMVPLSAALPFPQDSRSNLPQEFYLLIEKLERVSTVMQEGLSMVERSIELFSLATTSLVRDQTQSFRAASNAAIDRVTALISAITPSGTAPSREHPLSFSNPGQSSSTTPGSLASASSKKSFKSRAMK